MSTLRNEKFQKWESIIEDRKESGLSIVDYCRENKIAVATYHYWKKKISSELAVTDKFTEIGITSEHGVGLWFDFGNGVKLVVDHGFDQVTLKRLMGTVGSC
jgi:hypothetical protein